MTRRNTTAGAAEPAKNLLLTQHDPDQINELVTALGISPITAKILINRKITSVAQAQNFLNANVGHIHDPWSFTDMDRAIGRTMHALQNHESICIYGDYDVDGAISTSLCVLFFREIGYPVEFYIPNRLSEGYSLNDKAMDDLAARGIKLIITVDNGITAHTSIEHAKSKNMDVIVTDHHKVARTIPPAFAVINPQREDCAYPFKGICGAGVAYKFLLALRQKLREAGHFKNRVEPNLKGHLDLLAIATVADMVPLKDENRYFVKEGLKHLAKTTKPGLKALLKVSGSKNTLTSYDLGFRLGPRINACGRLKDASLGVRMLTSQNEAEALELATCLDKLNSERRNIESDIAEAAHAKILKTFSADHDAGLVVYDPDWHLGVVGIVASRLVEKINRPVFVLCQTEDGKIKGSGRSVPGVNLVVALQECQDLFVAFGGHEAAAGVTLMPENRDAFVSRFNEAVKKQREPKNFTKTVRVDAELSMNDINFELLNEMERLEPFGMANAKPVFLSRKLDLKYKRIVGETHLKLSLGDNNRIFDAIAFGMAGEFDHLKGAINLLYGLEINDFNNKQSIQMVVKDFLEDPS